MEGKLAQHHISTMYFVKSHLYEEGEERVIGRPCGFEWGVVLVERSGLFLPASTSHRGINTSNYYIFEGLLT